MSRKADRRWWRGDYYTAQDGLEVQLVYLGPYPKRWVVDFDRVPSPPSPIFASKEDARDWANRMMYGSAYDQDSRDLTGRAGRG